MSKKVIIVEVTRDGYSPSQVERKAATIEELICALEELGDAYGMDAKVFTSHDNGYTFGGLNIYRDAWGGEINEYGELLQLEVL